MEKRESGGELRGAEGAVKNGPRDSECNRGHAAEATRPGCLCSRFEFCLLRLFFVFLLVVSGLLPPLVVSGRERQVVWLDDAAALDEALRADGLQLLQRAVKKVRSGVACSKQQAERRGRKRKGSERPAGKSHTKEMQHGARVVLRSQHLTDRFP